MPFGASDMELPVVIISDSMGTTATSPIRLRSCSLSVVPSVSITASPDDAKKENGMSASSDDHLSVPKPKPRLSIPSLPSWSRSTSPNRSMSISSLLTVGRRLSFSIPLAIRRRTSSSVSLNAACHHMTSMIPSPD